MGHHKDGTIWVVESRDFRDAPWEPCDYTWLRHDARRYQALERMSSKFTRVVKYIREEPERKPAKPAKPAEPEVTDWRPCSTPPERIGVYERRNEDGDSFFQHWNGAWWGIGCDSQDVAFSWSHMQGDHQSGHWRGLTRDPQKT